MSLSKTILLVALCICLTHTYQQIDDNKEIMAYYEDHSYMPVLHVYYNRHFSKSKQWQSFLEVVEDTEYEVESYARIILTDCEYEKSNENLACGEIKRTNQNRMIIGYQPNSKFTSFGDKIMQAPPTNRVFDQISDTYTVEQLTRFINQLTPNFLKQIKNIQEFEAFKLPKYVPKLIFAAQEGQVPHVIKQLGVEFFLKFDLAYVEDLTESVVNQLEIKKFPTLIVLKHNFETGKLEIFPYKSHEFLESNADIIRKFLSAHALKERRNDYVFHLISMPTSDVIQTVDSGAELEETLDRIKSWVFLQQGPSYEKLSELRNKYGLFYDYLHHLNPQVTESKTYIMNPRVGFKVPYEKKSIDYRLINAEDLHSNMTLWLKKDYIVMGVRQQYGYLCTIIDKPLFAGMTQCFIIQDEAYDKVTQNIRMKFQYGFIVSAKNHANGTTKVNGNDIKVLQFQEIYRMLEYTTKLKVKDIIDDFMDYPVKNITTSTSIEELCAEPYKKCIFYFYEPTSDKTRLEYLELEALDFVNEYKIYSIDLSCNDHMYEEILQLKENHGGLIAFHPRSNKYVYLKAKMTRNVIRKFLEINNQEKKTLPFKMFTTQNTQLYKCDEKNQQNQSQQSRKQTQSEKNQANGQFAEQL